MNSIRRLALSNKRIEDVDHVLELETSVKAKGSSLEEVAELNKSLRENDVQPGEVGEMLTLMRGLKEQHLPPAAVKMWKEIDDELTDKGFDNISRTLLLGASETYGSIFNALTALLEHKSLGEIQQLKNVESAGLKEAQSRRLGEEVIYNSYKKADDAVTWLYASGWHPLALIGLPTVIKRSDTEEKLQRVLGAAREIDEVTRKLDALKVEQAEREKTVNAISPEQLAIIEKVAAMATGKTPPNMKIRDLRLFANKLILNYISESMKDAEMTQDEKEILDNIRSSINLLKSHFGWP